MVICESHPTESSLYRHSNGGYSQLVAHKVSKHTHNFPSENQHTSMLQLKTLLSVYNARSSGA